MQRTRTLKNLIAAVAGTVTFPLGADGQERRSSTPASATDSAVTVIPGPGYRAGPFTRAFLGTGWRDLWLTSVRAPLLDLDHYAGGLKFLERGGGKQTISLHFEEEHGWREYHFRSVDKFVAQGLPHELKDTPAGALLQDQISAQMPAGALLVPPFLDAVGILHVTSSLYVMPDDPRLGVYRDTASRILGALELKPKEGPDDKPGFAGSRKIDDTEDLFEALRESRANQVDERELLATRLIDFLLNDPDRTPDNSDWARFGDSTSYTWRPLPRDRDWVFLDADGLLNRLVFRPVYPKLVTFGRDPSLTGLTYATHAIDRRLLQRLTREDFAEIAARVHAAVTDSVIDAAIATMPASWRERTSAPERLRTTLRERRNRLPAVAMAFYRTLADDVDVYGTSEAERADVVRQPDGRVTVTVTGRADPAAIPAGDDESDGSAVVEGSPFYRRTFLPNETKEIRLYLGGGADSAIVRGAASDAIVVRVLGEDGDDVLVDDAGGGATHLYDADAGTRFVRASGTRVDFRDWKPLEAPNGLRLGSPWRPDWGGSAGLHPVVDYATGPGLIVGLGWSAREYGFRRLPYHWSAGVSLLAGTGNRRLGLVADADYRRENSPVGFTLTARATQLEPIRFFGFGNATPSASRTLTLVDQTTLALEPAVVREIGWRAREGSSKGLDPDLTAKGVGKDANTDTTKEAKTDAATGADGQPASRVRPLTGRLTAGPVLAWIDPLTPVEAPLAATHGPGHDAFGHVGVHASVELNRTDRDAIPTRGWMLRADVKAFPALWDLTEPFTTTSAGGTVYVPLLANGTHLAMRAGGALATGDVPVQYAPAIGGWRTLRGSPWNRYAGDAAVNGGSELHVPVGTAKLFLRWNVDVFGLADVGRVWFDGRSDGGWHTGVGGGVSLRAFDKAISVAYARGEANRFYLKLGMR